MAGGCRLVVAGCRSGWMCEGRPSFPEAAALVATVAEALHHAHLKRLRPADRVLDDRGVIPPEGGHHHGPRQSARRREGTAVATLDQSVAGERPERACLLCPE